MEDKEYVRQVGKAAAVPIRCTKPWHGSGRVVIIDAGFAGIPAAKGLGDAGLYMIGNVKNCHAGFPKKWLLQNAPTRGVRVNATSSVTLESGDSWPLLAAADMDKQPMALLGTAGRSRMAEPLRRKFTVIRPDGTWSVRDATLEQQEMHATYRACFNGVDKHNSLRQGNHNFEDS